MAIDVQKPMGRRLRVRVDRYERYPKRRFNPVKGQALVFNVAGRAEHRAMFRALTAFLKSEAWKKDIKPEEEKDDDA